MRTKEYTINMLKIMIKKEILKNKRSNYPIHIKFENREGFRDMSHKETTKKSKKHLSLFKI